METKSNFKIWRLTFWKCEMWYVFYYNDFYIVLKCLIKLLPSEKSFGALKSSLKIHQTWETSSIAGTFLRPYCSVFSEVCVFLLAWTNQEFFELSFYSELTTWVRNCFCEELSSSVVKIFKIFLLLFFLSPHCIFLHSFSFSLMCFLVVSSHLYFFCASSFLSVSFPLFLRGHNPSHGSVSLNL